MSLTDRERRMIARRAGGEHAVNDVVARIVRAHKSNRDPDDEVFLDFARLIQQRSYEWDEYARLQRKVLNIISDPWGTEDVTRVRRKARVRTEPETTVPDAAIVEVAGPDPKTKKRVVTCGICGLTGHNVRTCPNKATGPTLKYADGVERLSPGYDPNPPKEEP